ncbi:hypothetical protein PISL3812_03515 [Talaromyces islandicus]|uniref:Nudix hydrolase domain-containing protein n=1 Tax=Talaromyces islandicus TaxID=28573 RepID=A0A0U1LSY4_TALIS|nr:hypothetical protein PISL3812_03515 [Talaromyces islandicus]
MAAQVRVGVGVFVLESSTEPADNPRFLIGKRINSHGSGTYSLPGGHLEFGETPEQCAERELLEETGLRVKNLQSLTFTDDYMPAEGKHYVTLYTVCVRQNENQLPQVLEPEKCEGWEWVSWKELKNWAQQQIDTPQGGENELQRKMFLPLLNIIRQRAGVIPAIG